MGRQNGEKTLERAPAALLRVNIENRKLRRQRTLLIGAAAGPWIYYVLHVLGIL